jgi:hypothetical protein
MYSFVVSEIERSEKIAREIFLGNISYIVYTKRTPYKNYGLWITFFTDSKHVKVRDLITQKNIYETDNYNNYQELHSLVQRKYFGG